MQEWGFNDNGHFAGSANNGTNAGYCLGTATLQDTNNNTYTPQPLPGSPLIYVVCNGGTSDPQAYNPDASAGAGAATGVTTGFPGTNGQLVNFQEFGRCYDLTGQNPLATHDIDYPCKNAPNGTQVAFNQRYVFTGISGSTSFGTLSTQTGGVYYCMTQQGVGTNYPVVFAKCNNDGASSSVGTGDLVTAQQWTLTGSITNDYFNSFNIRSTIGAAPNAMVYCLGIVGVGSGSKDSVWSSHDLQTCDGSNEQKWNAPAGNSKSSLAGVGENIDH